jgi:DnaJ-class molecular chaperone
MAADAAEVRQARRVMGLGNEHHEASDLKAAYLHLAKRLHPDVASGVDKALAEERFKEVR